MVTSMVLSSGMRSMSLLMGSMPARVTEPESGSWRVAAVRISEDLPAPLVPSRPNISLPMVRERFLIALAPLA